VSDITVILKAAEFAAHKHRDQRRKGKSQRPYVGHCIEVARMIAEVGGIEDANVLAAAILHDTVEDTDTTPQEIEKEFGADIALLVAEVTDDKRLESDERKRLQVVHAPHISDRAKLIKLADKISNVREIGADPPENWDLKRRLRYYDWAKEVVDALGDANPALAYLFEKSVTEALRQTNHDVTN
jgi:GTP diphosphokinase / guanosine-3',5'-bis(diphosphate) 3'-diphosphatase